MTPTAPAPLRLLFLLAAGGPAAVRTPLRLLGLLAVAGLPATAALGPAPAAAQTPHREPAVVELPVGARAVGLGHAYQVGAPDTDALFHNPALLGSVGGLRLGVHVLGDRSLAATLSAAAGGWMGGGVALGLEAMEYEVADVAAGTRGGGLDPFLLEGREAVSELVAAGGYGRELFGVRVGLAGKLIDQRVGSLRDLGWAVDLGAAAEVGDLTVGLAVQDLGPDVERVSVAPLPTRVTLGAGGYGLEVGPLDLGMAAAVTRRDDGEFLVGGGVEAGYWPVVGRTFAARVGLRTVPEGAALPVTFGGSYWGDRLVVEYAFQPVDGEEGLHRITLGWR